MAFLTRYARLRLTDEPTSNAADKLIAKMLDPLVSSDSVLQDDLFALGLDNQVIHRF